MGEHCGHLTPTGAGGHFTHIICPTPVRKVDTLVDSTDWIVQCAVCRQKQFSEKAVSHRQRTNSFRKFSCQYFLPVRRLVVPNIACTHGIFGCAYKLCNIVRDIFKQFQICSVPRGTVQMQKRFARHRANTRGGILKSFFVITSALRRKLLCIYGYIRQDLCNNCQKIKR